MLVILLVSSEYIFKKSSNHLMYTNSFTQINSNITNLNSDLTNKILACYGNTTYTSPIRIQYVSILVTNGGHGSSLWSSGFNTFL